MFYNPFDFGFKNIANTGIVEWNNELLALWENDLPHALDPKTLETKGISRVNNSLDSGGSFGAHYKIKDGRLINFAGSLSLSVTSGKDMKIKIWEYA
jgi:all-trans-8'-apo-beta-carotenal 15,15'-oxygenase